MDEFYTMENGVIKLSQALAIMNQKDQFDKPVPFDITVWEFSRISKLGGKQKSYYGVWYLPSADPNRPKEVTIENVLDPIKAVRDPQHFENRTRNLQLPTGECRKIYIDFIKSINNQTVIY